MDTFKLTPASVSGIGDESGDIVLQLLDEILTAVEAAHRIEESGRGDEVQSMLLALASHKTKALRLLYDRGLHLRRKKPKKAEKAAIQDIAHAAEE